MPNTKPVADRLRRRDVTSRLEREIADLERGVRDDEAAAAQSRDLAAQREQLLEELAAKEAIGKISPAEVDAQLEKIEREAGGHLRNAEARERALAVRRRDLEERRAEIAQFEAEVKFEKALAKATEIGRERRVAERNVVAAIAGLAEAIEAARTALEAEDAAHDRLEQVRPEGETRDIDVDDSPGWPDVREVVEFLSAGPRTPAADSAKRNEKARRDAAAARRSDITSIIQRYGARSPSYYRYIEQFSEDFQEECNARFAKVEAEAAARRASGRYVERDEDGFRASDGFVRLKV